MSSNFYDTTGFMLGMDAHKYIALVPPNPLPVELRAGHVNGAQYYLSPVEDAATITATVTSDGKRMIQGKCKLEYIPHFPVIIPAPPYPVLEILEAVITMVYSSSVPLLRRQCVTGLREPMAVCLVSAIGVNLNCGDPVKMTTGGVFNLNSVKTQPSLEDLVPAIVDWIIDTLAGLVGKGLAKKILDKHLKKITDRILRRILKKLADDFLKNRTKDVLKKVKDKAKKVLHDMGVPFV